MKLQTRTNTHTHTLNLGEKINSRTHSTPPLPLALPINLSHF